MTHIVIKDFTFKVYKDQLLFIGEAKKYAKGLVIDMKNVYGSKNINAKGRTFYELKKNIIKKIEKDETT